MKKKSVFLSKVFAVALAASMAFSTPYASAATVSTTTAYENGMVVTTMASNWWTGFSDFYKLSGDFDVTLEFTNKSDGMNAWDNYVLIFANSVAGLDANLIMDIEGRAAAGYAEYYVLRADTWGWSPSGTNMTNGGKEATYEADWGDDFTTLMADATVSMNVKRTGDDFVVKSVLTSAAGKTYNYTATINSMQADKDMTLILSGQNADITLKSFTVNSGAVADTPATETPSTETPDTATDSAIDATPETPDTTTPETPAETPDTTTPETPAEPEDTTTAPAEDEEPAEEETVKAAAKLNKKKATVKVGKSVKLKVQNTTKKVTWSSSNKKVAKVNKSGKVTGVKAGKVVIKAKVGGKTLKCNVTVK